MEIIKRGSEDVALIGPLGCCYPAGTEGLRSV